MRHPIKTNFLDHLRYLHQSHFLREHRELTAIYVRRGLDLPLAKQVAEKLMAHDALGAHARDELYAVHQRRLSGEFHECLMWCSDGDQRRSTGIFQGKSAS